VGSCSMECEIRTKRALPAVKISYQYSTKRRKQLAPSNTLTPDIRYSTPKTAVGTRCADHVTPSTRKIRHCFADSGGRSVGIVRLRTKVTEFLDLPAL
jgi:hypothetical protein